MEITKGIKMLSKVISDTAENAMIVACSIGIGLVVTVVPELFEAFPSSMQILTSNDIVPESVTEIKLNIIFHMLPSKKQKQINKTPTQQSRHAVHQVSSELSD